MPRGVKRARNYNEELAMIDAKIGEYETKIKTLKSLYSSTQKEKEQCNLQELNRLLNESGLTVEDIMKLIAKPKIITA